VTPPPVQNSTSRLLLALLDSVLTPGSAIYAAGPLDTGRSYYEALARGTADVSVRAANEAALTSFVARLRVQHHPSPVIDPGPLRVEGWSPREVGQFFLETISRYTKEAWFIDGWEYSSGATKEYLHCASFSIPCFAADGRRLEPAHAVALLSSALDEIRRLAVPAPKLTERLTAFRLLVGGDAC
jgi:hypothetical protein